MKSPNEEYDALPEWARSLVDGMRTAISFGVCDCPNQVSPAKSRDTVFVNATDNHAKIVIGLRGASWLAEALQNPGSEAKGE